MPATTEAYSPGPSGLAIAATALTPSAMASIRRAPDGTAPIGRMNRSAASTMRSPEAKPASMFAQSRKRGGNPQTAAVCPSRHRLMTRRTIATPRTEITVLVTPTTLLRTTPVSTIDSPSQGPLTRALRGIDTAPSTTAVVVTRPMTSEASPAPPAPNNPARVTS